MKSYRKAIAALVLAFVFSTSAFADEGIIHTEVAAPVPEGDALTEVALTLLQSVWSLI